LNKILGTIKIISESHGLNPGVVYGVCMAESGLDQYAARYETGFKWTSPTGFSKPPTCTSDTELVMQKTSWGVMQVMGALLREQGYKGWLNSISCDVEAQIDHGCRYLAKQIKRYGDVAGIAAYNSGTPRIVDGAYVNQKYVDRVLKFSGEYERMEK
jgi:hypothetical protein